MNHVEETAQKGNLSLPMELFPAQGGFLSKRCALVCDIESDSFTDSSSTTLSDSNCPANSFCFGFLMALNKTWDMHLLEAIDTAAKTRYSSCFFFAFFMLWFLCVVSNEILRVQL